MADLCGLADGSLPADRRAAVEAWIAASPELQALFERQRRSLAATQAAAREPLPPSLPASVQVRLRDKRRRGAGPLLPRLAFGGVAAAAVAVALIVAVGGGTSGPTVADAAELAALPPSGPAPARVPGSRVELAAGVEGVRFPDFRRPYGWRAAGIRLEALTAATPRSSTTGGAGAASVT